jgi:hypothetical protein
MMPHEDTKIATKGSRERTSALFPRIALALLRVLRVFVVKLLILILMPSPERADA